MNETAIYPILERSVVALIVLASAWTALAKLAPDWRRWLTGKTRTHTGDPGCGTCHGCERGTDPAKP